MPERKYHLSLYLMKRGTSIEQTIRDLSGVSKHSLLNAEAPGTLFVKTSHSQVPWWVDFLNPLAADDIRAPSSRTTSAVLSLSLDTDDEESRTVCYTFGHGRHLLDQYKIDRSFGLRVALNTVDPEKLRGLDTRRQEDLVVNVRSQSSAGTDIASFDLSEYRDILTRAAGATLEEHADNLGGSIHGSDGVSFDVTIAPNELANRARHLLSIYQLEHYKAVFPFVDNILTVDPALSDDLDKQLEGAIRTLLSGGVSSFRCLYLAPAEVLDLESVEGFIFSSERGEDKTVHPELDLADYIDTRLKMGVRYSIKTAKRDSVLLRYDDQIDRRLSSIYRCLVAEVESEDTTFQLVSGRWYEIEQSFVERINREVSSIPSDIDIFPDHVIGETEQQYNDRIASELDGLLLDRRNITLGGGSNRVELCDIALRDRTLVHAKKRSASSALSHLWSQGSVAMTAMLSDREFRKEVRSRIERIDPEYVHIAGEGLAGSDYKIVYLIIGVRDGLTAWESLPFFSRVALVQARDTLTSMKVGVVIAGVPSIHGSE